MKITRRSMQIALAIIGAQVLAMTLMLGAAAMVVDDSERLAARLAPKAATVATVECSRGADPLSLLLL